MLLLDEPFGALDAKVRQELRQWLRRFHDEIKVTTLFVTHDQEEAFEVADRVVVMHNGRIEQEGTPQEVFDHPANAFVMDFLGNVNVFHGRVQDGKMLLGGIEMACPEYTHNESRAATAYIRPHELDIDRSPALASSLRAKVLQINPNGSVAKVRLASEEAAFELECRNQSRPLRRAGPATGRPGPRRPAAIPRLLPRGLLDLINYFVPDFAVEAKS